MENLIRNRFEPRLKVAVILLLLLVMEPIICQAVENEALFSNQPIADIQIKVDDLSVVPQVRYLLGLKIADRFSQEKLDQGLNRIKMLNLFSSVQVEKEVDPQAGVRLTIALKKQPIIEKIKICGNYPLFKNEVRKVIRVRIGDQFNPEILQQSARDIERLFRSEGYYQARVSVLSKISKPSQKVKVTFQIEKGWRTKVQEVKFEENGQPLSDVFAFQSILGIYKGNSLREVKLRRNIRHLESILVSQGFLEAKVSFQVIHCSDDRALLKIIIDRGRRVEVRFQGNHSIKEAKLRSKIALYENRSCSEFDLQESVEDIKRLYLERGFLFVKVWYEKKVADSGKIRITFMIQEGERVFLDRITFSGNRGISSKKLAGQMLSLQKIVPFQHKAFNRLIYEQDLKALKTLYAFEGYPWAEIRDGKTTFSPDQRFISKTVFIQEGPRVVVERISFTGNNLFPNSVLEEKLTLRPGSFFTEKKWQEDRKRLAIFYSNHGYIFVNITPKVNFSKERGSVEITYVIDEGEAAFFGKSIIRGNVRTRSLVIQDSLIFSEGEAFSYQKVVESNKNLSDLGIFRTVRVKPIGLEKQRRETDILVEVEEMNTGRGNLGVGFNSSQGYRGYLELREDNLFGTSLGTTLRLEYSGIGQQYNLSSGVQYARKTTLSLHDPLLMPKQKVDGNFDLFDIYEEKTGYDLRQNGVKIRLERPLQKSTKLSLTYRLEAARLHNVDVALSIIPESDRELTISSLKPTLSFDTRDSLFDPRRGTFAQLGFEFAGEFLKGESSFSKLTISNAKFFSLSRRLVLALETNGGYAWVPLHDELPIQERFYAGGLSTVRGYLEDSLGPRNEDVPTGGRILLVNNLEFRYDLYRQLGGVIFFDAGNVWSSQNDLALDSIRTSAGAGLRLVTPVGPIRLDHAWVLGRRQGEPVGKFYISVGHTF
ncbi:MAG: outer membrane protein assembly factor BamA [bacterium]|nr:outer membrane protein assembly factor BamA [bacterium]